MIIFNGEPREVPAGITLEGLLGLLGLDPALLVVTVDGVFVPRADYRSRALPDGARVRTFELKGGG